MVAWRRARRREPGQPEGQADPAAPGAAALAETLLAPPDGRDEGPPGDDREAAQHLHWAVATAVVVLSGAAVATLLLLAGHVL